MSVVPRCQKESSEGESPSAYAQHQGNCTGRSDWRCETDATCRSQPAADRRVFNFSGTYPARRFYKACGSSCVRLLRSVADTLCSSLWTAAGVPWRAGSLACLVFKSVANPSLRSPPADHHLESPISSRPPTWNCGLTNRVSINSRFRRRLYPRLLCRHVRPLLHAFLLPLHSIKHPSHLIPPAWS